MSLFLGVAAGAAIAAPSPSSGASDIVPVIPDPLSGKEEQVTKLPNGLSVLILKDTRFPLVSTRLYVHAGSSYETPDQAGISHVLEHMVFKGTDSRPKSAISQEVESAGGYLNAATSYDYTVYITDMPDRHWKLGMDVVRDMAFHPTLDPQELESEKNVIVAELQRGEDDPGSRMFKTLLADTLKGTPYDRPIIGYEKTIRALTTQNLRDYIAKYYQPQNMLLVVVGNVDPAEVLAEAEKMFAPYKNTAPLKEVMPYEADRLPLPGSKPALVVQPGPWNKVYLAAALPVPGSSSYQSATLDVLAYLLGGDRTSLFYKTYKYERQLVDSISVSNVGFERIGAFVVTAELDADKVEPFWTSLTKDFAALDASTFTPEQLERAKLNLEDDLYRSKETLSGLASKIGYFQFFMGGDQGERNAIEALRNVDNGMLKQVLAAWVQPDRLTTVVLPPKDAKMPDMQAILDKEWKSGAKASAAKTAEGHRSRQRPYRGAHPGQDPALRFREPDLFRRRRVAEAFRTGPLSARFQRADQGHGEAQRYRNAGVPCRSRGGACGFGRAQDLLGKPHHARPFQQGSVRSARRGGHGPRVQQGRNRPRHQGSARGHQVPRRPAPRARLQEAAALPLPRQRVRLPPARRAGKRAEIR